MDDPYATPKANLRDNVKTLAALLAGVAGLVLAGSPFSGLGSLEPWSSRFNIATLGLVIAAVSLFVAWRWLVFTLRPDVSYSGILRDSFDAAKVEALPVSEREKREIRYLQAEFIAHRTELLPDGIGSIEEFEKYLADEWQKLVAAGTPVDKSNWERYYESFDGIAYWATFIRLQYRVRKGINISQWFGVLGMLGLLAFAWAANPKKDDAKPAAVVRVEGCGTCAATKSGGTPMPQSSRVEFKTNEAELDSAAFVVVRAVAADLRAHPEAGALLLAHTDTVASDRVNRLLASRRADSVYRALVSQGGIAASRIFMSPLPKADLPVLTDREVPQAENRSVEILKVELPVPTR